MRTLVLIKQVPETGSVRMDESTGTVVREGVESILNPLDLYALELALTIRAERGGEVVVLSMGPPKAEDALREALAMGADGAALVTDKAFAGSDTWATSRILSRAVESLGDFDLILCGERATDGDTGQVGPGVAAFLGIPFAAYANRLHAISEKRFVVSRLLDGGEEKIEVPLPALATVVKEISSPRLPTLIGKRLARDAEIAVLSNADLRLSPDDVGLRGSPTRVARIYRPRVSRNCEKKRAGAPEEMDLAVERLEAFLDERGSAPKSRGAL